MTDRTFNGRGETPIKKEDVPGVKEKADFKARFRGFSTRHTAVLRFYSRVS